MSNESLIAGNTQDTGAAQPAAAAPVPAPAPAADGTAPGATAATEQNAPAAQATDATGNPPAAAEDPNAAPKPDDGKGQQAAEKPVVPEKYEFKAPEGTQLNPEVIGKFEGVAKELGLSQEAAQKVVDAMAPQLAAAQAAQFETIKTGWADSARTDKEFGGDKFAENLAVAKKALDTFGTPELRTLLNDTGLGNNPEIIRAFYRAGQKISGSNFVAGGAAGAAPTSAAATLYPNQAKG
jgi:hypothetical protein